MAVVEEDSTAAEDFPAAATRAMEARIIVTAARTFPAAIAEAATVLAAITVVDIMATADITAMAGTADITDGAAGIGATRDMDGELVSGGRIGDGATRMDITDTVRGMRRVIRIRTRLLRTRRRSKIRNKILIRTRIHSLARRAIRAFRMETAMQRRGIRRRTRRRGRARMPTRSLGERRHLRGMRMWETARSRTMGRTAG